MKKGIKAGVYTEEDYELFEYHRLIVKNFVWDSYHITLQAGFPKFRIDNKSTRGAFGEVQLNTLLENMLSNAHYELQSVLSNQKRADCLLKLPQPMGNLVIDSKFPLENYQRYIDAKPGSPEIQTFLTAFKRDIKKHINDIDNVGQKTNVFWTFLYSFFYERLFFVVRS